MANHISFDKEKAKRFKAQYTIAVNKKYTIFLFDGQECNTQYSKYIIEHLENKFGKL